MDNKQSVNKELKRSSTCKYETEQIYSPASSGSQSKYTECISFLSPPPEAALSIFNASIFV
jgi:hypothetical protein